MKIRLWKCRSVESVENQDQVSLSSHRPWKSLRDSHIPIASTTASLFTTKERTSDTTPYSSGSSFNEKMLDAGQIGSREFLQGRPRLSRGAPCWRLLHLARK